MRVVEDLEQTTIDYLNAEGARIRKIPADERLKIGNPQPAKPLGDGRVLVDNQWARDDWASTELIDKTIGFVIIDNAGNTLAKFEPDELRKAEIAYQNSRISIQVDFDVPEPKAKRAAVPA